MFQMFHNLALRLRYAPQHPALLVGAGLGWVAWELSRVTGRGHLPLVTAAIVLLAGAASYTFYALHRQARHGRPTAAERMARVRACVILVGCGMVGAMEALRHFA